VSRRRFTLSELSEASQVSPRTIRNYIENGLLIGPSSMGRGADYGEQDLERLLLIRRLREEEQLSLREIRHRLTMATSLEEPMVLFSMAPPEPSNALDYLKGLRQVPAEAEKRPPARRRGARWENRLCLEVDPDLEIIWKGPASPQHLAQLERIAALIRAELKRVSGVRNEDEQD
jgi:DNA-binding transcriptional MerR regulator